MRASISARNSGNVSSSRRNVSALSASSEHGVSVSAPSARGTPRNTDISPKYSPRPSCVTCLRRPPSAAHRRTRPDSIRYSGPGGSPCLKIVCPTSKATGSSSARMMPTMASAGTFENAGKFLKKTCSLRCLTCSSRYVRISGLTSSSASNTGRSSRRASTSALARTVAGLGVPFSISTSPKLSPARSMLSGISSPPSPRFTIRALPETMTWMASLGGALLDDHAAERVGGGHEAPHHQRARVLRQEPQDGQVFEDAAIAGHLSTARPQRTRALRSRSSSDSTIGALPPARAPRDRPATESPCAGR